MKKALQLINFPILLLILLWQSNAFGQTYCAPTFANGCSNWKNSTISIGTINWTAPTSCTTWDFTSTSTSITAGVATPMTVTNSVYCGCSVWIDINNDGLLDSLTENFYSLYTASSSNTYNFNITLPAGTPNGPIRMRVIASWGSNGVSSPNGSGPCGAYQYGNYDDFTLNVGGVAACAAPTGLTASAITSNSATISWTAPTGAVAYEYVVDNIATNPTGNGTTISTTTYNASSLAPLTVYYAHVRSYCGAGGYSPWVTYTFTTLAAPCAVPTGLSATGITSSSANCSWTAVSGASGYEYVVDMSPTSPSGSGTATSATTYNPTGLTPTTVYYLHVRTFCGGSNYSAWVTYPFTTLSACVPPANMQFSSLTSSSANISWTAASGAVSYEYVVSTVSTQPTGNGTTINNSPYGASGLTPSTTYYAFVRSYCGNGSYSPWTYVVFTTKAPNGVQDVNDNNSEIVASPNPSSTGIFNITYNPNFKVGTINVYDVNGKKIIEKTLTSIIDLKSFSNGLYYYKISIDNKKYSGILQKN